MSGEPIRLRRHTDGRVALSLWPHRWKIVVWRYSTTAIGWLPDKEVTGPDWAELLVTELPKPDYAVVGNMTWDLGYGELAIDDHAELKGSLPYSVDSAEQLRSDALKMLAAADAWERRQQEASDDAG